MALLQRTRWGHSGDALRYGLGHRRGIVCGLTTVLRRPVSFDRDEHCVLVAPPGGGKGATVVIPTLLQSDHRSFVVIDPKGEIEQIVGEYRAGVSTVFRFDPAPERIENRGHRYNPLQHVRRTHLHEDIDQLTLALIGSGSPGSEFWYSSARTLCTAALLYLIETCDSVNRVATLPMLPALFMNPTQTREQLFRAMSKAKNAEVAQVGAAMLDVQTGAPEQASGTIETLLSRVDVFRNPHVAYAFSGSDFAPRDLQYGYRPATVFVRVAALAMEQYAPAVRVVLTSIGASLMRTLNVNQGGKEAERIPLTYLVDEAYAFGRWEFLLSAMPVSRGFSQNFLLVYQSVERIKAIYGSHELLSMAALLMFTAVSSNVVASYVAERAGKRPKLQKTRTSSVAGVTTSMTPIDRDMITPAQVMMLRPLRAGAWVVAGYTIVFTSGRPMILRQRPYWVDAVFRRKLGYPPKWRVMLAAFLNHFRSEPGG